MDIGDLGWWLGRSGEGHDDRGNSQSSPEDSEDSDIATGGVIHPAGIDRS